MSGQNHPMNASPLAPRPRTPLRASLVAALAAALALAVPAALRAADAPAPAAPVAPAAASAVPHAPSWKLLDPSGAAVTSDQFKGKVLVVDFWATWCGPCRAEIPGYVDLQRKYGKDGLAVIGVSVDQGGPKMVSDFVQRFGVAYTIVMADDTIAENFGVGDSIPTTYIVDRNGVIRFRKVGSLPEEEFEKKLLPILNEAPKA